ncbi:MULTISPECIES: adenylosuccinate lyase [unclassified Candidatus Frackibacter]|uniref:adenylosuccinate lyase n=1 Tax=unclassified Candidatus Frackibacter TaxID=2648818 RepID=UPI00087FE1AE|nr:MULTISPECIES: adenylosuccinate lyase [unclassified Candidatus Frackibacter]SDC44616.1 adenylosuccinate lyase [Candidatus Frackibacter sp. WG11]SEM64668.1 adenylosuccinate lyase [Candidatus Frackibacter sp. WG12]SFL67868.1 adenylosuccinate lyase [Candidatus Frackibacter sp. WG13]
MVTRNIFANISPLDHRYSLREDEFQKYSQYLSEEAKVKCQAEVEVALVKALAKAGICSMEVAQEVKKAAEGINPEEVYKEERKTKHNIRALVNCIQRKVSEEAKPYVHFTTTSFDIVDTANSLRYKKCSEELILPTLKELEKVLMEIALREKETIQTGRTHGQHAVPVTFGFAVAEYVDRLGNRIKAIDETTQQLKGKISGAVGAYNASHLFFDDPEEFEANVLAELDLKAGNYSTQIVEPEYLTDFVHSLVSCFGVIASFSDDMRHLQRSEIGEVGEYFDKDQVGSSTMPHKRNPINYENVKSMWKEFMPRMVTIYQDQLSEHQRDLTNSASSRFIPEIIVGFLSAVNRLIRTCKKLVVDQENMKSNFDQSKEMIVAEPLYILLASLGHPDAHEAVRRLTLESQESGQTLRELIQEKDELKLYWDKLNQKQEKLLINPEEYIGIAVEKTEKVVNYWKNELEI